MEDFLSGIFDDDGMADTSTAQGTGETVAATSDQRQQRVPHTAAEKKAPAYPGSLHRV